MLKSEIKHLFFSLLAGSLVGFFCRNYYSIPVAFLSGFFVDADHLIDYGIYKKFRKFNLSEFLSGKFFDKSGKVYVFFHGFEYVPVLIVMGVVFSNLSWLFLSLGLSLFFHLCFDTIHNRTKRQSYFFTFRLINHFSHNDFCSTKKTGSNDCTNKR